jgi:hypothetical protein
MEAVMIKIGDVYKTNRPDESVKIIYTTRNNCFPIVGLLTSKSETDYVMRFRLDGTSETYGIALRLPPPDNVSVVTDIDTEVWVRSGENGPWYPAHYAGESECGVNVFNGGRTSFSQCNGVVPWRYSRLASDGNPNKENV